MTGDPFLTVAAARDPQAEGAITGGLADYNREAFGRVDAQPLDILVRDDNSGEIVGGLLGHSSLGLLFLDLFHLPPELDALESELRRLIKNGVARGHVQVHVAVTRAGVPGGGLLNRGSRQTRCFVTGCAAPGRSAPKRVLSL